jgi:hypothetical protein
MIIVYWFYTACNIFGLSLRFGRVFCFSRWEQVNLVKWMFLYHWKRRREVATEDRNKPNTQCDVKHQNKATNWKTLVMRTWKIKRNTFCEKHIRFSCHYNRKRWLGRLQKKCCSSAASVVIIIKFVVSKRIRLLAFSCIEDNGDRISLAEKSFCISQKKLS